VLFEQANFTIHQGQKVGLTGANGTGKSSLFAMILGQLSPDEGELSIPPKLEIAHVAQETPALETRAIDYVLDGDRELRRLQQALAEAEQAQNGLKVAELHEKLSVIGAYSATARASKLLSGLGFSSEQESHPVSAFSGGWRMRLNLAQALMCRSDVLLLDEPTNHLDLDAVIWLQDWLLHYPGTLLLISHDRDFLDAIADHILHIEHQHVTLYSGNYSAFETLRAEKLAQQQSAYARQQREIAHIQSFINRFKAKATKAKQAQSRVKSLERMSLIAQAHVDSPFSFQFTTAGRAPNPLLKLEQAALGYDDNIILNDITFRLSPGDRIGLLGPNGAGKSTFIKVLAGQMPPLTGQLQTAEGLRIGYFAQHQLEQLRLDESPLWHFQHLDKQATEKALRNFLGGFDFRGDKVNDPVGPFSGGEKARLVLALLVYQKPNLLLLDEPTNHLDLEMRHALIMALQDYDGAMVIVSHDRHMLRSVTDRLWLVADKQVRPFDGDLDDYRQWLNDQKNTESNETRSAAPTPSRKDQRKQEALRRQQLKPLTDTLKKAEQQLERYQQQQADLEQRLSDPALYETENKQQLKQLLADKQRIDQALLEAETSWMDAAEQLEHAQND